MSPSRKLIDKHPGLHEPLISYRLWEQNQQLRRQKATTPTGVSHPRREYMLSGISFCAVCLFFDGTFSTLRGSTSGNGDAYYRCARIQERYRKRTKALRDDGSLDEAKLVEGAVLPNDLLNRHSTYLRLDQLEPQVNTIVERLIIPIDWYESILAYYLTDEGLTTFERERFHLRQLLSHYHDLKEAGYLSKADHDMKALQIAQRLQSLSPSVKPEARVINPLLTDFPALWHQATSGERRVMLRVMFAGLFFDADGKLVQAKAHEPFDELLGLSAVE